MTVTEIWGFIQSGGIAALLFIALVGVFAGWWAPRHVVKALERERDEWKDVALQNMRIASTSVDELKERRPRQTRP